MLEEKNDKKIHVLKTWSEFYKQIVDGNKNFEIRKNDRGFKVGDVLVLQEFDNLKNVFTGEMISKRVSYITDWEQKENFIVMGLDDIYESQSLEEIKKEFDEITKQLFVAEICDECSGTGDDFEDSSKNCGECSGTGKIKKLNPAIWQFIEQKLTEAITQAKIEESEYWQKKTFDPHSVIPGIALSEFQDRINELKGGK